MLFVAVRCPIGGRSHARPVEKDPVKAAYGAKAQGQGDAADRQVGTGEQVLGVIDPQGSQIVGEGGVQMLPEQVGDVAFVVARGLGKLCPGHGLGVVGVHILHQSLEGTDAVVAVGRPQFQQRQQLADDKQGVALKHGRGGLGLGQGHVQQPVYPGVFPTAPGQQRAVGDGLLQGGPNRGQGGGRGDDKDDSPAVLAVFIAVYPVGKGQEQVALSHPVPPAIAQNVRMATGQHRQLHSTVQMGDKVQIVRAEEDAGLMFLLVERFHRQPPHKMSMLYHLMS